MDSPLSSGTPSKNTLPAGLRLGRYEICSKLGAGGMGEVYLAQDTKLDRKVALKILPADVAGDHTRMRRFVQEAKAASALNHPNIITIHEIEQIDSVNFIATEFIDGVTLRQRMRNAPLKLGAVLDVAAQIASALAAAHAAGIVHRDIKPENVMLRRDGIVKVLDFGLAKLTERLPPDSVDTEAPTSFKTDPGTVVGTVVYMSPEQARGMPVDARTDIFSLGVVLYEMVAGCLPFVGSTSSEVLASLLSEREPQLLARYSREAPAELERIASKALRKNRDERYQTIKDLLIDLKDLQRELLLQAQLERRAPSELPARATTEGSEPAMSETAQIQAATRTGVDATARTTSSAKILLGEIKRHQLGVVLTLAALVIAAVASFFYLHRQPALTDKDTVLIADFVNTTGDPVFDGTLKDALAVQLEQSPFLRIFPEEQIRQALRFMSRSPDERLTTTVAREICERQAIKAYFTGSIASLGRNYVIKLEAINARTGDTLARTQVEAEGKEQVLKSVGQAATSLREKLGESLASIQKFDTPIVRATTPSLEALKAFSLGKEEERKGHTLEAIPLFKRAIELDPDFALAYASLSGSLSVALQRDEAAEAATKAFDRRDRVSERERYIISISYYSIATGETESVIETANLWARAYPRDAQPHISLAGSYNRIGEFSKAGFEADEAIRLDQNLIGGYVVKAWALTGLNRFDPAKEVWGLVLAKAPDSRTAHDAVFLIAFNQHDTATMQQQIDWARGRSEEQYVIKLESGIALQKGQLHLARDLMNRAIEIAQRRNLKEVPADFASLYVEHDAFIGTCRYVREDVATMLTLSHSAVGLARGATSLALCGDLAKAESLAAELVKQHPKHTFGVFVWLPATRAAIEMRRGNPDKAIQLLQAAGSYANASFFWHPYLLGMAYLSEKKGAEAAAEFQKVIDNPGQSLATSLYPLSYLGLARAAALMGDTVKARTAYQDFFALWKDADPDIPILTEAKKEYEKLK